MNGKGARCPSAVATILLQARRGTVISSDYNARPVFIYAAVKGLQRPAVKAFVEFYLRHAADRAAQRGIVPLTAPTYELAHQRLARGLTGTMYESPSAADTTVELLLSR